MFMDSATTLELTWCPLFFTTLFLAHTFVQILVTCCCSNSFQQPFCCPAPFQTSQDPPSDQLSVCLSVASEAYTMTVSRACEVRLGKPHEKPTNGRSWQCAPEHSCQCGANDVLFGKRPQINALRYRPGESWRPSSPTRAQWVPAHARSGMKQRAGGLS